MKKVYNILYGIVFLTLATVFTTGCQEHYITYSDKEYIMFSDTSYLYVVREDIPEYAIPVVSTVKTSYDRNFAVEVIEDGSDAVEGRDYVIKSYNFTIPAGQTSASVMIAGIHENLDSEKQLSLKLKLVVPESLIMSTYGDCATLRFQKTNKFDRSRFTGWAVVSSMFLYQFSLTGRYQKLIYTEPDPDNENGVILKSYLADGYDVKISFDDDSDPASPVVYTPDNQVVSDEGTVFGMVHGDNHIMVGESNNAQSYFLGHAAIAVLIQRFYVEKIGEEIGTVGNFLTEIDWISEEEAMRLKREEGM